MKLSKIYSDHKEFEPIIFLDGLNVILGDIIKNPASPEEEKESPHNLGKTTLSHLIDFMLLKKTDDNGIIEKHSSIIAGWTFFLEIELNNGKFLTIKREIDTPNKISIKEHSSGNQNFIEEKVWDLTTQNIGSKKDELKTIFQNQYLSFDVCKDINFRHFLGYLIRTQNDYQDIFRLNLFRGADIYWKPQLFSLLGFDGELVQSKYVLEENIKKQKEDLKNVDYNPKKDNLDKIHAAISAKNTERDEMDKKINQLNFFEEDQKSSEVAAQIILDKISSLNSEEYRINYNIQQIQKTLDQQVSERVDLMGIEKLFAEIKIYFPNELKHQLEDVVKFSEQITIERNTYLRKELSSLMERKKEIVEELKDLNIEWSQKVGVLVEKDKFMKYNGYREEIAKIDAEILILKRKVEEYKRFEELTKKIDENSKELEKKIDELGEIASGKNINEIYEGIRSVYAEIFRKSFQGTALLYMEQNGRGNIDFRSDIMNESLATGQGDGWTATKIQCASFTLALLVVYAKFSFFRFAYLDGLLEGLGDPHKIKFIEIIRDYCGRYRLQFVITAIKSDIPDGFSFNANEIRRTLSKGGGELFGRTF